MFLDRPTAAWIGAHTTPGAVMVAEAAVDLVGSPIGVWIVAATALAVWRWGGRTAALRVLVAAALAVLLAALLPTSVAGTRFPAVSVTWLTAALVSSLPPIGARRLHEAIRVVGAGARC